MNTPPVLLPYQIKWVFDTSPVKVREKSRRIGASWCEASDDALYAAGESGGDTWYIGYNKEMAEEFIGDKPTATPGSPWPSATTPAASRLSFTTITVLRRGRMTARAGTILGRVILG